MSLHKIGLRYERLLLLSAPLSLACILVAFIAIASDFSKDKMDADCREKAAVIFEKNLDELNAQWGKRIIIGKTQFANEYVSRMSSKTTVAGFYPCDFDLGRQEYNQCDCT